MMNDQDKTYQEVIARRKLMTRTNRKNTGKAIILDKNEENVFVGVNKKLWFYVNRIYTEEVEKCFQRRIFC